MAIPQGTLVWGNPRVAGVPDAFRYVYRTYGEAQSYLSDVAEAVRGRAHYSAIADLAAITRVGRGSVPGVARDEGVRSADPRWVRSMAGRRRVRTAAREAGMTPEEWVRGGGFVGPANSPRWNLIEDALTRDQWYAVFVLRDYEVGPRGGMTRMSGKARRRR